jgi:hypothetical protein
MDEPSAFIDSIAARTTTGPQRSATPRAKAA